MLDTCVDTTLEVGGNFMTHGLGLRWHLSISRSRALRHSCSSTKVLRGIFLDAQQPDLMGPSAMQPSPSPGRLTEGLGERVLVAQLVID